MPVRCSTNWAMEPHIGSKVNLLSSYFPVQWNDVKFNWNNSYVYCGYRRKWRVIIAVNFQFKQLERRSMKRKKLGLQRDSNPWPPRYRCDAQPTDQWSHTLGARSIYWVHILDSALTKFQLKLKEAMHINWEKPNLNQQVHHVNLTLTL